MSPSTVLDSTRRAVISLWASEAVVFAGTVGHVGGEYHQAVYVDSESEFTVGGLSGEVSDELSEHGAVVYGGSYGVSRYSSSGTMGSVSLCNGAIYGIYGAVSGGINGYRGSYKPAYEDGVVISGVTYQKAYLIPE